MEEMGANRKQDYASSNLGTDRCKKKLENPERACSNPCSAHVEEISGVSARRRRMEILRLKAMANHENFYDPNITHIKRSRTRTETICDLCLGQEEIPSDDGDSDTIETGNSEGEDTADPGFHSGRPPAVMSVPVSEICAIRRTCGDLNICPATIRTVENISIGEDQTLESIDDPSVGTRGEECYINSNSNSPTEQSGINVNVLNRSGSNPRAPTMRKTDIMPADDEGIEPVRPEDLSQHCPAHGFMSVIGRKREMEDAIAAVPYFFSHPSAENLHFFGVYDGHGGSQASTFCKDHLHEVLAEELIDHHNSQSCGRKIGEEHWTNLMSTCFVKMDIKLGGYYPDGNYYALDADPSRCYPEPIAPENVGSTAVVAVVSASQIVIANCGDSRAVLCRGGNAIPLSIDHKPERVDEMCRIEAAGGRVICWSGYRVLGLLALSRSIGDRYLKNYVISEPEVTCTKRSDEDECLILASNGLWNVLSNEMVCEVARKCLNRSEGSTADSPVAAAATLLTKLALGRGSDDNISVLVVDLRDGKKNGAIIR